MLATHAIKLTTWICVYNLSIRGFLANELLPIAESNQSVNEADEVSQASEIAPSVQQAEADNASDGDPSTWHLSVRIPEPVYQYVPFSFTTKILDKNDKEVSVKNWSPVLTATKCIRKVKKDFIETPDQYVATELGRCNVELKVSQTIKILQPHSTYSLSQNLSSTQTFSQ
ncbi:hypothetical protein FGIG_00920 [Fasciola gigantica]|uniref:Uncharacterized protein n=1 Tax=Fasciola gigantica TaxID=46835 RepID=A0A504Z1G9_FASGI|nr:hypothetical protein FGIG_00920 [Fasciola gigantica]